MPWPWRVWSPPTPWASKMHGSVLGANLTPCWVHVGHNFALKGRPNASQDALGSENPPRPPPDLDFHRFFDRFLFDFPTKFHNFFIDCCCFFIICSLICPVIFLLFGGMTTTAPPALATHDTSAVAETQLRCALDIFVYICMYKTCNPWLYTLKSMQSFKKEHNIIPLEEAAPMQDKNIAMSENPSVEA